MGTLFYTVIFNARAHDAKRCLFIHNVAEVISTSKQSLRSPIISPITELRPLKSVVREKWGTHDALRAQ